MNRRKDGYLHECSGLMDESMNEWMQGLMDEWMDDHIICTYEWINGCRD